MQTTVMTTFVCGVLKYNYVIL